uniref:uncharacterized protein LOC108949322 isoform X2 n=1 Tax=Ciona intestinalis TaxID=7719 RepID=UPI000EF49DAB|nr:uncharacterized protein LOC108949322 isoform X2 [Ciona intestinalis]|eukprot:XP_026689768.1 uncharacterized protein LOC108949322 isoform X2 [Ciona intestinalis]
MYVAVYCILIVVRYTYANQCNDQDVKTSSALVWNESPTNCSFNIKVVNSSNALAMVVRLYAGANYQGRVMIGNESMTGKEGFCRIYQLNKASDEWMSCTSVYNSNGLCQQRVLSDNMDLPIQLNDLKDLILTTNIIMKSDCSVIRVAVGSSHMVGLVIAVSCVALSITGISVAWACCTYTKWRKYHVKNDAPMLQFRTSSVEIVESPYQVIGDAQANKQTHTTVEDVPVSTQAACTSPDVATTVENEPQHYMTPKSLRKLSSGKKAGKKSAKKRLKSQSSVSDVTYVSMKKSPKMEKKVDSPPQTSKATSAETNDGVYSKLQLEPLSMNTALPVPPTPNIDLKSPSTPGIEYVFPEDEEDEQKKLENPYEYITSNERFNQRVKSIAQYEFVFGIDGQPTSRSGSNAFVDNNENTSENLEEDTKTDDVKKTMVNELYSLSQNDKRDMDQNLMKSNILYEPTDLNTKVTIIEPGEATQVKKHGGGNEMDDTKEKEIQINLLYDSSPKEEGNMASEAMITSVVDPEVCAGNNEEPNVLLEE